MTATKPSRQYLQAELVLKELCLVGIRRIGYMPPLKVLTMAGIAGALITAGAYFSILLAQGVETPGLERLIEGFGFSAGFFFVILADAVLFTEANVVLPATMLNKGAANQGWLVVRFWGLAWAGNLIGAFLVGWAIYYAQHFSPGIEEVLTSVVTRKMSFRAEGGVDAWFRIVVSGVLANWLVGMAAFFAVMARTIIGKYVPILLAVTLFVAANFQHSPANMGFFSLIMPTGAGPGWGPAFAWNIIPAGIGNMIGGTLLVALPFWYALTARDRAAVKESIANATADRQS